MLTTRTLPTLPPTASFTHGVPRAPQPAPAPPPRGRLQASLRRSSRKTQQQRPHGPGTPRTEQNREASALFIPFLTGDSHTCQETAHLESRLELWTECQQGTYVKLALIWLMCLNLLIWEKTWRASCQHKRGYEHRHVPRAQHFSCPPSHSVSQEGSTVIHGNAPADSSPTRPLHSPTSSLGRQEPQPHHCRGHL